MQIVSFNVNGVRAITGKTFLEDMKVLSPDILCLQETKATVEQVKIAIDDLNAYHVYANQADKKGYSGTAILSKLEPISVSYDMGITEHDTEGRVIAAEFEDYYVVTVYTPNSGNDLRRLDYRQTWDAAFLNYLKGLEAKKPVLVCGDLNVAHKEIDLARPKPNYNKSAGFMQEEIDGLDNYTSNGFVDTFRFKNADEVKYSWWSYRGGARDRNVGWRIDYFLASESLTSKISKSEIHNDILGSDHCPISITLK
ncbi:MAG: exodeoxyribonuclease III [Crocinitomicaceae bacterium]|nr:exodeoxyribonuclease III [Flavobacteriales bacterium]NQZ36540.1 exodeoxyribonuclease III [Crocinitomicaceae bacterium]